VSRCSKRSILADWRSTLTVTVAWITWWLVVPSAPAEKFEVPTLVASLSVSTIQSEPMLDSVREQPDRPAPRVAERTDRPIPVLHGKPTDTEAWESFEAEYTPPQEAPSLVKHQIESAKYGLDTTLFALDRFVKSIRDHADFELDQGRLRHTRANPSGGFLDNPRVKLDLDMLRTKPYIGVRVVIPFGK
jgi:hypothetical protein